METRGLTMSKPSRFNDKFAHLRQHYEASEPKWLKGEREKAKATAEVLSVLDPPWSVSWNSAFLDMLFKGAPIPPGFVPNNKTTGAKFL